MSARQDEPMRVAHLLDGRHFGGAEQIVRRMAAAAPGFGIEAHVYCLGDGRLSEMLRAEGVPLRVIPSQGRFDFGVLGKLRVAAVEDRIQILQAHTSRTHLLARLLGRRLGVVNITTIHSPISTDENQGLRRHRLRAAVERMGRRYTDHVVSVSREELERLRREEHLAAEKSSWIPNGIEPLEEAPVARGEALHAWLAERGLPRDAFVAAMVAQLRPRKGPEVLLRAFAQMQTADTRPAVLLVIGSDEFVVGGYLPQLQRLAGELGIEQQVRFTGFHAEPWSLAGGADAICLPSLFGEGLPLAALEGMNGALPLLASNILGNRELVTPGESGELHPPGDAAALAGQLREMAENPEGARRMGLAGRERFLREFTLAGMMRAHAALYTRLISLRH